MIAPYPKVSSNSTEDDFNFYHSNCRIRIECTFGKFIMRRGLFWRSLQIDSMKAGNVIQAAALIQNFIIDERETGSNNDANVFKTFSQSSVHYYDEIKLTSLGISGTKQ